MQLLALYKDAAGIQGFRKGGVFVGLDCFVYCGEGACCIGLFD